MFFTLVLTHKECGRVDVGGKCFGMAKTLPPVGPQGSARPGRIEECRGKGEFLVESLDTHFALPRAEGDSLFVS